MGKPAAITRAPRRGPLGAGVAYLGRLPGARVVLWCYLLWYLVVAVRHFDASPRLWLTSLGLSGVVGVALLLNAGWRGGGRVGGWQAFRFFLMPFCVSSFSALVKGRGFFLVISPRWQDVTLALVVCGAFVLAARLARGAVAR